jgi:hypothetical protein
MPNRSIRALTLVLFLAGVALAEAQTRQRYKFGGGAGFAVLNDPDVDLGRVTEVGASLGFRFSDNVSIEFGMTSAFADNYYDEFDEPVDELRALAAYRFQVVRYDLDGTFFYHIGRREPFHAFVFGGGGLARRDRTRHDIDYTFDENGIVIDRTEVEIERTSVYDAQGHFGAGFDIYVLYNVAARVEFRIRVPQTTELWSRDWFFGASYYW